MKDKLANTLRETRRKAGLSQLEAANLCKMSLSWYKYRELGLINDSDIPKLAEAIEKMEAFTEAKETLLA